MKLLCNSYFFLMSYLKFLIEQPKKSFAAGLELTNVPFKEAYKNLENPETRALTERIKKAVRPTNLACFS